MSLPFDSPHDGNPPPDIPNTLVSYNQAWERLINDIVPQNELTPLVETIFSNEKAFDINRLRRNDAQTFIDVVDKALDNSSLTPQIRRRCVKSLRKMCADHALVPSSLKIELCNNPSDVLLYRGGFGDVWKREYQGREVAVKVLRIYATSDLRKVIRRFCKEFVPWKALQHPNVLPLLGVRMAKTEFAMVSDWMSNGNINQFVIAHHNANRFELLADVANGLIYIHGQGMVHGDLKGANILVDQTYHARLADFGLITIISDSSTFDSSTQGGTIRWMSPELFDPETQGYRQTKFSDCYALGMVVYEVLSGRIPFHQYGKWVISSKVSRGDRPERPQGAEGEWFTDDVWEVIERCWMHQPGSRPSIENVLQYLEKFSRFWTPSSRPSVVTPSTLDLSTLYAFEISNGRNLNADEGEASSPFELSTKLSLEDYADDNNVGSPLPSHRHVSPIVSPSRLLAEWGSDDIPEIRTNNARLPSLRFAPASWLDHREPCVIETEVPLLGGTAGSHPDPPASPVTAISPTYFRDGSPDTNSNGDGMANNYLHTSTVPTDIFSSHRTHGRPVPTPPAQNNLIETRFSSEAFSTVPSYNSPVYDRGGVMFPDSEGWNKFCINSMVCREAGLHAIRLISRSRVRKG
ncbi:kinase-like protein [Thelephora ganbajun]|uniref:Kinase-like protein n=1 Tax=Thelephora ganbajun TaxID=370292 RepID=A0ACB6ZDW7_THEGA|nr:kinase-like protein [Thelephora ganbajun]